MTKPHLVSERALYTYLRRGGSSKLVYPRYPQVYLSDNFESRISPDLALEQFILDEGAEVSYQSLSDFSNDLGLKDFQFLQCLSKLSNVVRTKRGSFVHVACVDFDLRKFDILLDAVRDLLQTRDQVSIVKVFNDRPVTCAEVGIDSPEMLFSFLRLISDDDYDLSCYPVVRLVKNGSDRPRVIVAEVAEYVRHKQAPCSFDELETRFVEELGYGASTVHSVTKVSGVLRFGPGSVVHVDSLKWTDEKQSQLEGHANDVLTQANAAGRCYSLITELMEYSQLPPLGNGIAWTQTLLAELLRRGQRFRVLGSARNSFVRVPNEHAIETLEDLLCQLLRTSHDGAEDLSSFEEYLRRAGIVRRKLTSEMLGKKQKVTIVGSVIMLSHLYDRA